ncbi:MAG: ribosome maturation factor RimM [Anaerolineales bacterium]
MAAPRANRPLPPAEDYVVLGWVVAPHGVRGEIKVASEAQSLERFLALETVWLGDAHRAFTVTGARLHQGRALLLLDGVSDRDAAEGLRGQTVYLRLSEAEPLAEGAYYYHEVEGLAVIDEQGQSLGVLAEVLPTGANDVYVVQGPRGELLLPAIHDVILSIEPERGRVIVRVPAGLEPES